MMEIWDHGREKPYEFGTMGLGEEPWDFVTMGLYYGFGTIGPGDFGTIGNWDCRKLGKGFSWII
jgi:hypothetical protein